VKDKEKKESISCVEKILQKKMQQRSELNYQITALQETIKMINSEETSNADKS